MILYIDDSVKSIKLSDIKEVVKDDDGIIIRRMESSEYIECLPDAARGFLDAYLKHIFSHHEK